MDKLGSNISAFWEPHFRDLEKITELSMPTNLGWSLENANLFWWISRCRSNASQRNQKIRRFKKHCAICYLEKLLNLTILLQPLFGELFQETHSSSNHESQKHGEERGCGVIPCAWAAELCEYPRASSAVSTSWLKSTSFRTKTNSACSSLLSYSREPSNCSTTQKTGIINPGETRCRSRTQTLQSKSRSPWWEGKRQL